jgi:hypothetical protein
VGQIILYNVTFLRRPNGPVAINISYSEQGKNIPMPAGTYTADADGNFNPAVIINVKDNTWYVVRAKIDCGPCVFEKVMYPSSDGNPDNPCCAPQILSATVAVACTPSITWVGIKPVCLQDSNGYNTGVFRYLVRERYVDGVADGYSEPNTPGPDFVADETNHVMCPLPVITWAGLNPYCIVDVGGFNTGMRGYIDRARLVSGVPDGYTEANTQNTNYVAPIRDLINCPLPAYTWRGTDPFCINDPTGLPTGMVGYNTRERLVNGVPDGYSEPNTVGINYVTPIFDPAACPQPLITWQGDAPVCQKDFNGFNTGMVHYTIRKRLQNGAPDGYSEANTPGPNFVSDELNETLCPPPVITWVGITETGYCVLDEFGNNTGMFAYAQRGRIVNGIADGYIEDNEIDTNYVPPVLDLVTCPLPTSTTTPGPTTTVPPTTTLPVVTWQGINPYCQLEPYCDEAGYVLSPDGSTCTKEETMAPTITHTDYCLVTSSNNNYTQYFARIYKPGFSQSSIGIYTPGSDTFAQMDNAPYWRCSGPASEGPANRSTVWIDSDCNGIKDALAAGQQTTITFQYNNAGPERTIYVGVFGDNYFTLKVNNDPDIITPTGADLNFKIFHIFPVTLSAGMNYFNLVGTGDGGVNDAIGMIIYDDPPAAIRDATSDATLHILFNSASLRGSQINTATCPTGWVLDTSNPTAYICRRITREDSSLRNTGWRLYADRERLINGVADGFVEPNALGPNYVPGVLDTTTCPV